MKTSRVLLSGLLLVQLAIPGVGRGHSGSHAGQAPVLPPATTTSPQLSGQPAELHQIAWFEGIAPALQTCMAHGTGWSPPDLGFAVYASVDADGGTTVRLAAPGADESDIACFCGGFQAGLREVQLPLPEGGGTLTVMVSGGPATGATPVDCALQPERPWRTALLVRSSPPGAGGNAGSAARVLIETIRVKGGLDGQALQNGLKAGSLRLDRCYSQALQFEPKLSGTLPLSLHVRPDGRIDEVRALDTSPGMASLVGCIQLELKSEVPLPPADAPTRARVRLRLNPAGPSVAQP